MYPRPLLVCAALALSVLCAASGTSAPITADIKLSARSPWKTLRPIATPSDLMSAVSLAGRIYLVGGGSPQHDGRPSLQVYDPSKDKCKALKPMPLPRANLAVGAIDGIIYAAGGDTSEGHVATLEAYDPKTDQWSEKAPMPSGRAGSGAVAGGRLYVLATAESGQCTASTIAYDPATDSWSTAASMPTPRCGASATSWNGRIYVAGGTNTSGSTMYSSMEEFDPQTNTWTTLPPMPIGRHSPSLAAIDGVLYVTGGRTASGGTPYPLSVELQAYNLRSGIWTTKTPMPTARFGAGAAVVNGALYIIGGANASGKSLGSTIESYDPSLDRVSRISPAAPQAPAPLRTRSSDVDFFTGNAKPHPDDFALIVGIEDYRGIPKAAFGARDAGIFRRYAQGVLGVPEENIIFLEGDKAARTDVVKYVEEWLPRNVTKDSRVYFYYSGHGAPDPSKGTAYLVPWDGDPQYLESTAYPLSRLYDKLGELKAKNVLVMLDTCFSGMGGRSVIAKDLRPLVNVFDAPLPKVLLKSGHVSVLTAASGDEVAGGLDAQQHGLFTYFLLKGLRGEAVAEDGHVDLGGLYDYVHKNVLRQAHRQNREQNPKLQTAEPDLKLY